MTTSMRLFMALLLGSAACNTTTQTQTDPPAGDGFSGVYALDSQTVIVTFSRVIDRGTVTGDAFEITDRTVAPAVTLPVDEVTAGDADVTLRTAPQEHGRLYTLKLSGLRDANGYPLDGTLNFRGGGEVRKTTVTFVVDDTARIEAWGALRLELTADPTTGAFSDRVHDVTLTPGGVGLVASAELVVDSRRTLDRRDDTDPVDDRRAYAARVIAVDGNVPAGPLVPFEVASPGPITITLPLLEPPTPPEQPTTGFDPPDDPNPGDGKKRVRLIIDDRLSRELVSPALKMAFTADGEFDVNFPQTVTLQTPEEPRFFETIVEVNVDPNRVLDGTDEATLPYVVYLVNAGTDVDAINASIIAPDETPEAVVVPLGNASMTPVLFRVDVGGAFLTADGTQRGVFPDESVWLTGEWQVASDALGRNAGDAFTGGEQVTLEMRRDDGNPDVWHKAIWLPRGRPYGWKVVRCASGVGCAPLNRRVASSGRAFPTVMKNLATENQDAFAVPSVVIVNPHELGAVPIPSGNADYSDASVYVGMGMGGEDNPDGIPRADTLFKQEVPDLAVVVGDVPVITPVYIVGTWRDVNLPVRPAEILSGDDVVELTPYDYDEGFIGRYPPSRSDP